MVANDPSQCCGQQIAFIGGTKIQHSGLLWHWANNCPRLPFLAAFRNIQSLSLFFGQFFASLDSTTTANNFDKL